MHLMLASVLSSLTQKRRCSQSPPAWQLRASCSTWPAFVHVSQTQLCCKECPTKNQLQISKYDLLGSTEAKPLLRIRIATRGEELELAADEQQVPSPAPLASSKMLLMPSSTSLPACALRLLMHSVAASCLGAAVGPGHAEPPASQARCRTWLGAQCAQRACRARAGASAAPATPPQTCR